MSQICEQYPRHSPPPPSQVASSPSPFGWAATSPPPPSPSENPFRLRGSLGRPSVRYRRIQPGHFNSPYNVTVWDMLSRISVDARYVNRLAVVDAGNDYAREEDCARKMTYGDLLETASALAMYLVSRGLQRGDRVALVMPNALEVMVAHYACAR